MRATRTTRRRDDKDAAGFTAALIQLIVHVLTAARRRWGSHEVAAEVGVVQTVRKTADGQAAERSHSLDS